LVTVQIDVDAIAMLEGTAEQRGLQ